MIDVEGLAVVIKDSLGHEKEEVSDETRAFAKDLVDHIKTGLVNHATAMATAGPGGPISDGAAPPIPFANFVLVPIDLVARLSSSISSTTEVVGFATQLSTFLMTMGVEFAPGKITGNSTNSAASPGPVIAGGEGGKVVMLFSDILALGLAAGVGQSKPSEQLKKMAKAIADYLMKNAEASYKTGTVTGVAPAGGGPAPLVGAGGQIK